MGTHALMLRLHNLTGAVSELLVASYLSSCGYEVFLPISPHSRADLIYVDSDRPIRVQVKTATWNPRGEHEYEQVRVCDRINKLAYTPQEIDELWAVGTHLWKIPVDVIQGKTMMALNTTNPSPRKTVRDYDPNEYVVVFGSLESQFRDRAHVDCLNPFRSVTNDTYSELTAARIQRQIRREAKRKN